MTIAALNTDNGIARINAGTGPVKLVVGDIQVMFGYSKDHDEHYVEVCQLVKTGDTTEAKQLSYNART